MENCFICDKHAAKIETAGVTIYEDEYVYVGHIDRKGNPNYLGHIMIDLKRHAPTLADMTTEEAKAFGVAMTRVSKALVEVENAEHIYSFVSGNSVPHLHMHLVARYPNTPREYWGASEVYDWEHAPMGNSEDVIKLCERLQDYLETIDMNDREFYWIGSQDTFIDHPSTCKLEHITIGRFGGNSSADQYKNEDGCLVWTNENQDFEFTILLDAHMTSQSAELIIAHFHENKEEFYELFTLPIHDVFKKLEHKVLHMFQSKEFLAACQQVTGETACLIVARKDKYLWWFSVGDCVLYLFHEELAAMGQYQVNERHFYEWIGQVNTFELPVPCYSSGTKELRKGTNYIFLTTDGLIECPNEPFENPENIYQGIVPPKNENAFQSLLKTNDSHVLSILKTIQENNVRDSTTIISWKVEVTEEASKPSDI